jgi:hypothetical protein
MANPLRGRLRRGAGCLASTPAVVGAALLGMAAWPSYLSAAGQRGAAAAVVPAFLAVTLAMSVALTLPLFLAVLAVNLPAGYLRSQEYELVCATPLADGALVWGFVLAALYRARAPIALAAVVVPVLTLIFPLPWPFDIAQFGPQTDFDLGRHAVFAALFVVAMLGRALWVAALGVVLFLWWRITMPAQLAALLIGEGLWWLAAFALTDLTQAAGWTDALPWQLAWTTALAIAPFFMAGVTLRAGARTAR